MTAVTSMEPLSARIPSDLYLWLAQLQVEGATTNSDKLRVLLGQLKRQHDGAFDAVTAHAWARDLTARLRESLVRIELSSGQHSEVLNAVLDHIAATLAIVVSAAPSNEVEAAQLEDVLVRRAFALCEALLRQATTELASAHDRRVVRKHLSATVQLATTIRNQEGA